MKFRTEVYDLDTYESGAGGVARRYRLDKERIQALGQGDVVVFEARIVSRDVNCDIALEVFTSTLPNAAPADGGQVVKLLHNGTGNLSRVVLNVVGRHSVETETRLQSDVELVLEIVASSGAAQVRAQVIVVATIYTT